MVPGGGYSSLGAHPSGVYSVKSGYKWISGFMNAQKAASNPNVNTPMDSWKRPLQNSVKINVDGAFNTITKKAAVGVIARNSHGLMVDGCAFQLRGSPTTETAEPCAFNEGVRSAISNGWARVEFEGDASNIVAKLERRELDRSLAAAHLVSTVEVLDDQPGARKSMSGAVNDSTTKFPISGKVPLEWLMHRLPSLRPGHAQSVGVFVTPGWPSSRGFGLVDARSRWLCATCPDNVTPNAGSPALATVLGV
ncbi:hypothetical protein V6N13_081685 [Hibiscus sabdariffa]